MAGLGRRTHYRKHLTDSVLYDLPTPKEDECIAKVVATRGSNQFEIILPNNENNKGNERLPPQLAILPTKFHKLVWIKRNDFVIVQTAGAEAAASVGQEEDEVENDESEQQDHHTNNKKHHHQANTKKNSTASIRHVVSHILYKDQIKHLVEAGLWPLHDAEFQVEGSSERISQDQTTTIPSVEKDDDGIVYSAEYYLDGEDDDADNDHSNDQDLFINPNRISALTIDSSSSDEDDDNDEDE